MSSKPEVSIVIPSFNSAPWLPSTLNNLFIALKNSHLNTEILVIDDGSTDDTQTVLKGIAHKSEFDLRVIKTPNKGVFEARRLGALEAQSDRLVFVDSRVLVASDSFSYLEEQMRLEPPIETRNGHMDTAADVPLVGRFWEVPTFAFWGSYLRQPKLTKIDHSNFDHVPKGTTFLVVEKDRLLNAYEQIGDPGNRFVSDDTKLLRSISEDRPILLDPNFRATYRPRTSLKKFLTHGFLRGTLFIDSYYKTNPARSLVIWILVLTVPLTFAGLVTSAMTGYWPLFGAILGAFYVAILAIILIAARNRAPWRALLSFLVYSLPFSTVFWAGLVRGLWLRMAPNSQNLLNGKTR